MLYALIDFRVTRMSDDEQPDQDTELPTLSAGQIIVDQYETNTGRA